MTHCIHEGCTKAKEPNEWFCKTHMKKSIKWNLNINHASLRKSVLKNDQQLLNEPKNLWQTEIPYDTRDLAIKDAVSAYRACCTNKLRGNIETFKMQFKERRSKEIFWIDNRAIKIKNQQLHVFTQRLKEHSALRLSSKSLKRLPPVIKSDSKLYYDRGAYYFITTTPVSPIPMKPKHPIISLDPGVRTFMTGYSPTGMVVKMGEAQKALMEKLHNRIDHLRSVRSKTEKRRTKWRIKQRLEVLERKLFNVVDNLHNHATSFLTRHFHRILLPTFGTSEMLQGGCLAHSTKRCMSGLAHYRFQQKMIHQCNKHGCQLYLVGEEYTTKACGACGRLKNVGGSKIYHCDHCNYTMDRDIHGSRNILLKTCSNYGV